MQQAPGPYLRPASPRGPTRRQLAWRRASAAVFVVAFLVAAWQFWPSSGGATSARKSRSPTTTSPGPSSPTPAQVGPDSPIKHVIFLVKENHSFDNYFGKYPGADGATVGKTLQCDNNLAPGPTVPLTPAPYVYPHDLGHAFDPGLISIDGGKMDGFNCVTLGDDLTGYTQFDRSTLPVYWALADRFVLADHFFTSMFGPTFPEHLYTVAAQSYGIVDNKSTTDHPGNYCDDPTEYTKRFPIEKLSQNDINTIMALEDHRDDDPSSLFKIAAVLGRHPHLREHQDPPRRAGAGRHHVEVLRQPRRVDERAPGDPPRPERSALEQGATAGHDPGRHPERRAPGRVLADPPRGESERASGRWRQHLRG